MYQCTSTIIHLYSEWGILLLIMAHPDLHKKLLDIFKKTKDSNSELHTLIHALLTPSEINDVSLRLEIMRRLKTGESQRSIAETLGVGIATVTRGSRQLKQLGGVLDKYLK